MKRSLKWLALAGMLMSLNSCGLVGPVARSTGRLANAVGPLVGPALTAAAL